MTTGTEVPTDPTWQGRLGSVLRHDVPASLVVFLIALPLSLGIAIASGAPVVAGLIAAAVGGIVAGATGGSVVQVSGPAAGLTVIVAEINVQYGWQVTCLITLLAGLVQIALGAVRVARTALAVSPAIVHGMLAGVGITIALAQIHVILGDQPQSSAVRNILDLPGELLRPNILTAAVGLSVVAVMLLWPRLPAVAQKVPGALVAVVIPTAAVALLGWNVPRISLPDNPLQSFVLPKLPEAAQIQGVVIAVFTVALVASVESLLSAVAVDKLHDGPRVRLDRELVGQGAANVVTGALGGYPVTGVIVRSSTNVRAGARSRASTVLHGVWILASVAALASLIERIPVAALAGLLVVIGVQLVNIKHIRHLRHHRELPVYVVTAAGVVMLNLIEGVLLGVALAVVIALRRLGRTRIRTEQDGDRWHVRVAGSLTFLSVPGLSRALAEIPDGAAVDVDLYVDFMDHAAFDALHSWRVDHQRRGGIVDIDEIHERWYHPSVRGTPPKPAAEKSPSPRWFAPWSSWQPDRTSARTDSHPVELTPLVVGTRDYHRRARPLVHPFLQRLAREGQKPSQMFITCADSRIVPNLITASGPGDLFTLRNIGNLVPPYGSADRSVGAAVEYAVDVLGVRLITVCGHSSCGAMNALAYQPAPAGALPEWLAYAADSRERWLRSGGGVEDLAHVNIALQLDHLLSYPSVRAKVAAGQLRLAGLYFDIEGAELFLLDQAAELFRPLSRTIDVTDGQVSALPVK
ncbi:SulP family inorganic anion transporter [Fodinicola acaciae]|uniref:SulP family inorganic anion transporter n=1 Tax=Fodinicola acaciae TaxID=2681555 RepID=UPI0013D58847|nr:bifunctional SulP family inorganic anion transporter/carbonic anhydrase [Fodinicola acaciae]